MSFLPPHHLHWNSLASQLPPASILFIHPSSILSHYPSSPTPAQRNHPFYCFCTRRFAYSMPSFPLPHMLHGIGSTHTSCCCAFYPHDIFGTMHIPILWLCYRREEKPRTLFPLETFCYYILPYYITGDKAGGVDGDDGGRSMVTVGRR